MSSKFSFIAQHYHSDGGNNDSTNREKTFQHSSLRKQKKRKFNDYCGLKIKDDSEISTSGNRKHSIVSDSLSGDDTPVLVEYKDESLTAFDSKWIPVTTISDTDYIFSQTRNNGTSELQCSFHKFVKENTSRHDSPEPTEPSCLTATSLNINEKINNNNDKNNDKNNNNNNNNINNNTKNNNIINKNYYYNIIQNYNNTTNNIDYDDDIEVIRRERPRKDPFNKSQNKTVSASAAIIHSEHTEVSTVYRNKDGHRIDSELENLKKTNSMINQVHNKLKSGLVQVREREEVFEKLSKEKEFEFARLKTDSELNELLKSQKIMDDPLIEMKKNKNQGKRNRVAMSTISTYAGLFSRNRFGIRPGYRWDGVDRSNGFEKERYRVLNEKKDEAKELYKWGCEDL